MTSFEKTLQATSRAILRRELTENERIEFMELAAAIGQSSVEDYLYILMIFKKNEDKVNSQMVSFRNEMKERFDEMGILNNEFAATHGKTHEDMLSKMADVFVEKADDLANKRSRAETWRSWALMMTGLVILGATTLNAGYIMASGTPPYWLNSINSFQFMLSWFFNVPSGWILLLGSSPFLYRIYADSIKKVYNNKRFGIEGKINIILYAKHVASLIALTIITTIVLYATGFDFLLSIFY